MAGLGDAKLGERILLSQGYGAGLVEWKDLRAQILIGWVRAYSSSMMARLFRLAISQAVFEALEILLDN